MGLVDALCVSVSVAFIALVARHAFRELSHLHGSSGRVRTKRIVVEEEEEDEDGNR